MSEHGERRHGGRAGAVSLAKPVGRAGTGKAGNGMPGWLPGHADAPMSPEGAKRPNRHRDLIHIQAL
jgi:hypothetical protein